ncbi:hypothetical protein L798_14356 [Zootermopsis nevadensis]|uniref:Uncharacterized protein n=1 Tax=Zootermopsis nevadensis TaxID=136037 RepID=A0A067QX44_ZOONE|nr:hypothetical protein L798_14356 [Zootermopsis nevadensis]
MNDRAFPNPNYLMKDELIYEITIREAGSEIHTSALDSNEPQVMHWAARLLKHCRRAALCGGLSHRGVARTYVHAKKTYSRTLPQC